MIFFVRRIVVILFSISLLTACSNYQKVLRKPQIYDGKEFGRVPLPAVEGEPFKFHKSKQNIELPDLEKWAAEKNKIKKYTSSEDYISQNDCTALLIIRNDSILFEEYYNGATEQTATQIFSITKPLIASLLMQALNEGRIESLDDKVLDYYPISKQNKNCEQLTLKHLANMQSGFNHYDYFRLFKVTKLYYAKDVDQFIQKAKVSRTPGGKFKYKSFDTQVLGNCLEHIFDEENLLERFSNLYWQSIRPEHKGYFSVDAKATEKNPKYYGGLNISARDLAKIGKIYLNDGKFEDEQVINQDWMNYISDTSNHVGKWDYSLGWYFDENGENRDIFYGAGFNGQYLIINKTTNTIVVRLGASKSKQEWFHSLSELSMQF